MRRMHAWFAVILLAAGFGLIAPSATFAEPYCGITWGSLDRANPTMSTAPIVNVRAGQHPCFDRLVIDLAGSRSGFAVRYVDTVVAEGSGAPVPLRGGAFLQVSVLAPAYDQSGNPTYNPANRSELVNVAGYQTFRQVAFGGSFEGHTTIGLGVRARLPFQVFTLDGPGSRSRLVIDVAHYW